MTKIKILFILGFLSLALFGCKKDTPTNPGAGDQWETVKHDSAHFIVLPDKRPRQHKTTLGANVYWDGEVSQWEKDAIDRGIAAMLGECNRNNPNWKNPDGSTLDVLSFTKFKKHSDYHILLMPSNYRSQSEEVRDCPLIILGRSDAPMTACGTLSGIATVNGRYVGRGGVYLIVPKQDRPDNPACLNLWETCIRYESMHNFFLIYSGLYEAHANDWDTPTHEYCRQ